MMVDVERRQACCENRAPRCQPWEETLFLVSQKRQQLLVDMGFYYVRLDSRFSISYFALFGGTELCMADAEWITMLCIRETFVDVLPGVTRMTSSEFFQQKVIHDCRNGEEWFRS